VPTPRGVKKDMPNRTKRYSTLAESHKKICECTKGYLQKKGLLYLPLLSRMNSGLDWSASAAGIMLQFSKKVNFSSTNELIFPARLFFTERNKQIRWEAGRGLSFYS
jgi:hypothetical protein